MFLLNGDLCQMGTQKQFLQRRGYNVTQVDVYPALQNEEEYVRALADILDNKIEGWWNYSEQYKKYSLIVGKV